MPTLDDPRSFTPELAGRWRVGALGGALGALPLLALARTLAARIFSVPGLPGAERAAGDVKQASYLEAAVLIIAVPAAAVLFGVFLPRLLRSRGRSWWAAQLPGIAFGAGFLVWRAGLSAKAALVLGAILAVLGMFTEALRGSRVLLVALLLGLFAAGVSAYRSESGLDLFEDGQILLGAQTLAHGGRPFVDFYPLHGWGTDGGWDAAAFRVFGQSLETYRWRRAVMTGLALVFLAGASGLFFRSWTAGALGFLACLAICPFLSDRQMLPFACWCAILIAAQSGRPMAWLGAGALAAITLFGTLDFGMVFLVAGVVTPLLLAVLQRQSLSEARTAASRFTLGAIVGAFPFVLYLAIRRSLGAFVRASFLEIPGEVSAEWGLPAPSLALAAREGDLGNLGPWAGLWLLLGVLTVTAAVLVMRAWNTGIREGDRAAATTALIGIVALRGVFGRSEPAHWMLYGVFAGLLAAWLLVEVARVRGKRAVAAGIAALGFFLLLRPDRVIATQTKLVIQAAAQSQAEREKSVYVAGLGGGVTLRREQAQDLLNLKAVVDRLIGPSGTFFDFGNEPGLYFLLGRRSPVRYHSAPCYESVEKQREVIASLERERPALALLSSGTHLDAFDGVASRERAPLVARYLDSHYPVWGRVGTRTLGLRKDVVAVRSGAVPEASK